MFEKGDQVRFNGPLYAGGHQLTVGKLYRVERYVYGQCPDFDRVVVIDDQGEKDLVFADKFSKEAE